MDLDSASLDANADRKLIRKGVDKVYFQMKV